MGRFGNLCILLLAVLLTLPTVTACSNENPALSPPDSATASPVAATPEPTSTSIPRTTEELTATALSSATALPVTATPEPTATSSSITIDCDDPRFTKQILELSKDNQNPFSARILKLYSDVEEQERTKKVLRCKGTATLSRGGESYITYHYEIDRDDDAFIGYEIGDPISTPTPDTISSPGFTLDNPLSAGDVLQGSDGTEIRVLGVVEDARRQVAEKNQFNDPPKKGMRFYMISVEVSYPSGSGSVAVSDLDFSLIGENRVVYGPFDYDCGVIPNELDGEVYGGGRIEGNICFEIAEDEAGFFLIHEPGFGAESRRFLSLPYSEVKEPTPTLEATASPTTPPEPTATPTPESMPTQTPTATTMPTLSPTAVPSATPTALLNAPHSVSGQGTDIKFVDLPAGQWVVQTDLSNNTDRDLTQIQVGGDYVVTVFDQSWSGRSLINVGTEYSEIPPGRTPIETRTAQGASWTITFVDAPPASDPTEPVSGQGQDVKFVDLPNGQWVVEIEVSGNKGGYIDNFGVDIGGMSVVDESGHTWSGRKLITVGNAYSEIPTGSTAIEVEAESSAMWTLTFIQASSLPASDFLESVSGQGTDIKFVDLPAGQWVVQTDLSNNTDRDLTQIQVGGDYVVTVFDQSWSGRSLINVGTEYSEIPPGRTPIETRTAQGASWTITFVDAPPASDPTEPVSGQGQDVKFVDLPNGQWVVEIEVSGNKGGYIDNFGVDIGGMSVVDESGHTWSGRKLITVGNAYSEIPPGSTAIEVEAESPAMWTLTFTRQ